MKFYKFKKGHYSVKIHGRVIGLGKLIFNALNKCVKFQPIPFSSFGDTKNWIKVWQQCLGEYNMSLSKSNSLAKNNTYIKLYIYHVNKKAMYIY
jgi:hypothetical protein